MFMIQALPVEQFILSVKNRPALWNCRSGDYKDRELRRNGWLEICQLMYPNFVDMSKEDKAQLERDLQLKWKNLRDAYVRFIRKKLDTSKSKSMRSYIYYHQMSFLRKVVNPNTRIKKQSTYESNIKDELGEERELTQEDFIEMVEHEVNSGMILKKDEDEEVRVDPETSEIVAQENYGNDDMDFFKSLIPTLHKLKTEQKLKFRIDVMELLMTYHQSVIE